MDGAGKTTLADRLAAALRAPALRAWVDGLHQPRHLRYRRGELSAEGYYRDSFDYPTLLTDCLLPFRDGAPPECAPPPTTTPLRRRCPPTRSTSHARRAVLVVDGVFLLRPELRARWTLSVHLRESPEEILRRARGRDAGLFGSEQEVERRYLGRYLPGQILYRAEADQRRQPPSSLATTGSTPPSSSAGQTRTPPTARGDAIPEEGGDQRTSSSLPRRVSPSQEDC